MDEKQTVMWCGSVLEMTFDVAVIQESDDGLIQMENGESLYSIS